MTDRPTGPADRIGAKLDADLERQVKELRGPDGTVRRVIDVTPPSAPKVVARSAIGSVGIPPAEGPVMDEKRDTCLRCGAKAFWFVLCDACFQTEIDARGRYVRTGERDA